MDTKEIYPGIVRKKIMAVNAGELTAVAGNGGLSEAHDRLLLRGALSGRERGRPEVSGDNNGARAGDIHEFEIARVIPGNRKEYEKYSNDGDNEESWG